MAGLAPGGHITPLSFGAGETSPNHVALRAGSAAVCGVYTCQPCVSRMCASEPSATSSDSACMETASGCFQTPQRAESAGGLRWRNPRAESARVVWTAYAESASGIRALRWEGGGGIRLRNPPVWKCALRRIPPQGLLGQLAPL